MTTTPLPRPRPVRELIAESPLVPVALAASLGLLADRYLASPVALEFALLIAALAAGFLLLRRRHKLAPLAFWCACGALAALHHYQYRNIYRSDDIGNFTSPEPKLARLRGVLGEEPTLVKRPPPDGLASFLPPDPTRTSLEVREVSSGEAWLPVSGNARLTVDGPLPGLHVGDEVEVFGWLSAPRGPGNPGEFDWSEHLRDQRTRAEVRVRKNPGGVTRLAEGWSGTAEGWLARLRGWGQRVCERELPPERAGVASALLLGENASMTTADWDKYVRTGVIHVLAISGQQLVILGAFVALLLRLFGTSRRMSALIIAGLLLGYALLTGFRPPVQRAAITAGVACLAVLLRRRPLPANTFALAWLLVIILNPTDPFGMGCQLAFLQVAVLIWGIARWMEPGEPDPLGRLVDESRPAAERLLRAAAGWAGRMYLITIVLGLVALPLVAARQNLVSLSGFLIGPPVIVLMSIAMIAGFAMLLAAPFGLAAPFALAANWSLAGCDVLVGLGERLPYGHVYVAQVPGWWLWAFYLGLLALLWCRPCWPRRRWFALGAAGWMALGLLGSASPRPADELRVTFLAVGHGGCTVLETPDGRVLLYDAGATGGPEVTRRHVAPFLWSRGYRRIDELFLSHADLDHFNGVVDLLERFEIGRVTCTPSFADKNFPGVRRTLATIHAHKVPIRIVQSGDQLTAGDVTLDVLHPPADGPPGNENVRSLVLRVSHLGHTILLTGDLESPGLERVAAGPGGRVDVMMSPHHGSPAANTKSLAQWAKPRLVVVPDAKVPKARKNDPYAEIQADVWVTETDGAVTVHSHASGLTAEAFRGGRRLVIRGGAD